MVERAALNWILAGSRLLRINGKNNTVGRFPSGGSLLSSPVSRTSIMSFYISIPGLTHSPTKNRGQIQVILGPMFSGKSTELMRRIKRYSYADHDCLIIKYAKDCRYSDDYMSTHDKHMLPAIKAEKLSNVELPTGCSVIGIDEGQFFSDIVEFSERMASRGIRVIVAALDGTFQRKPFGSILDLIPLAESVIKLNAVCMMCRGEAAFTKRIGSETKVEVIGGTDKYMAVCRECYEKLPNASSAKTQRPALGERILNEQDITPECEVPVPGKYKKASVPKQLFFTES